MLQKDLDKLLEKKLISNDIKIYAKAIKNRGRYLVLKIFRKKKNNISNKKLIDKINLQDIVTISYENNITKIDILKECNICDFTSINELEKIEIPIRTIIRSNANILECNCLKQTIYLLQNDNSNLIITIDDNNILISNRVMGESEIEETEVKIKRDTSEYKVVKYIHDLNYSTKLCKFYPSNIDYFSIDKKEALQLATNLFEYLKQIDGIDSIVNVYYLYDKMNLTESSSYNPVISDNDITLSWNYKSIRNIENINESKYECLDIIMNDTKEIIGNISFNYICSSGFTYGGNVGCFIKEKYRHNHYATKALNLLKMLLENNKYSGNRDLYISTLPDNEFSQKVAINNGGTLVYSGVVPSDDILRSLDVVEEVKVYRIKI